MSSAWFQSLATTGAPLRSTHGVREGSFPRFFATMRRCDASEKGVA